MAGGGMTPVKLEGIITDDLGGELDRWSHPKSIEVRKELTDEYKNILTMIVEFALLLGIIIWAKDTNALCPGVWRTSYAS